VGEVIAPGPTRNRLVTAAICPILMSGRNSRSTADYDVRRTNSAGD